MIERISAITLATHDMERAIRFYQALGFELSETADQGRFATFLLGPTALNLIAQPKEVRWTWWGRVIFYVQDVDATYRRALDAGLAPSTEPADATWGERYFHLTDPDGHELSFAKPL